MLLLPFVRAYELPATITANGLELPDFQLDPSLSNASVRVIVLVEEADDIQDNERLQTAAQNPAFEFLHDTEEDIYSVNDGQPFQY